MWYVCACACVCIACTMCAVCTCMSQVSPTAISFCVRDVRMRCFYAWFCAVQKSIFIAWKRKTSERSFSYFHIYTQFPFWLLLYCEKRHSKLISRAIFHRTHTNTHLIFRFSRSPCGEGKNWTEKSIFKPFLILIHRISSLLKCASNIFHTFLTSDFWSFCLLLTHTHQKKEEEGEELFQANSFRNRFSFYYA